MRRQVQLALAMALCAAATNCGRPAPPPAEPAADAAPLIPRADLFGEPERAEALISPDGAYISFLTMADGVRNVAVAPVGGPISEARLLTRDREGGVAAYRWAADGRRLLVLRDRDGDENYRISSVSVDGGEEVALTPEGARGAIVNVARGDPGHILVAINDRDRRWADVYRVDLATGERALVQRNDEQFAEFYADHNNIVRLAIRALPSGAREVYAFPNVGDWTKIMEIAFEDTQSSRPLSFAADGLSFYMIDSTGKDKARLVEVELMTGDKAVLGESPRADVSDVWIDPTTFTPQAFASEYLTEEWTGLTDAARDDIKTLEARAAKTTVVSRSDDDTKWIVVEEAPTMPPRVVLYDRADRAAKTFRELFSYRPGLSEAPLQPMIPREIMSSDGQTLVSYLTLPPGSDANGDGRPEAPVPLVMLAHGGPWARVSYGYDAQHQWLANRRYAVLAVNHRGSTGFGKAFVNLGNREWGGAMQRDLLDAAKWAVDQGIASRDQIAIFGASYGGYAALAGLAFHPDSYACGVDLAGPSNLVSFLRSIPPHWEERRHELHLRVGDPTTADGLKLLQERSPLAKAGDIARPLLIAQGANDPRVPRAESDQMAEALRQRRLPVTYLVFPNEGHGFRSGANRTAFYAIAEGFLQKCLGGRAEPIGRDLEGAKLDVRVGADLIPGLTQALSPPPQAAR